MNNIAKKGVASLEAICVHVPYHALSHKTLAEATGQDPDKYSKGLGCRGMAICHPTQDTVTMAAEAGEALLENWKISPDDVGMLVVATETAVDWAKPIASYVHQMIGISPACRIFDVQHACFGASAALANVAAWVGSGMSNGKKAMVIASDIARYELDTPGEPTQGAGAVAMLVGEGSRSTSVFEPDFSLQAIHASNVMDFWRPGFCDAAVVNGKYSVECYLESLGETYGLHRRKGGESFLNLSYLLFHLPFPRMSWKALCVIADMETRISGSVVTEDELAIIYDEKVLPGTIGAKEIGNIYCGSLYLSLAALLETRGDCASGERIGMFTYGSGSCAEFFTGTIGAGSEIWEGKVGLLDGLSRRKDIGFADYLKFRDHTARLSRNNSYKVENIPLMSNMPPDVHNLFLGYRDYRRVYIQGPAARVATSLGARAKINSQFEG